MRVVLKVLVNGFYKTGHETGFSESAKDPLNVCVSLRVHAGRHALQWARQSELKNSKCVRNKYPFDRSRS